MAAILLFIVGDSMEDNRNEQRMLWLKSVREKRNGYARDFCVLSGWIIRFRVSKNVSKDGH